MKRVDRILSQRAIKGFESGFSAIHEFINKNNCNLGETIEAILEFITLEYTSEVMDKLKIGLNFDVCEGAKVVGRGVVTEII